MPTPHDFATRAFLRAGPNGIQALLDDVIYDVIPFGDDAMQIQDADGNPVATLTVHDGQFTLPDAR